MDEKTLSRTILILLGVLLFVVLVRVCEPREADAALPTVEPECLNPPAQWQPGEPPWDGSLYRVRFCVPHRDQGGGPILLGEILGCGIGVGRKTLPGYMTWIFTQWKLAVEPGEIVLHPFPIDAPSILQGSVHAVEVICVRRGPTPETGLISPAGITEFYFPGPEPIPDPPSPIGAPSLREFWTVALAALLALSGARLARRSV